MDTILFGKYQVIRTIGQGRSGTVYLALHLELDEYRAIKQVSKACADYRQFKKEALLLKRLRHPGIPIVYDLQEDEEFSYLIEEYVEGISLYDLISKKGRLNQDAVVRYGIQIAGLVHYLHSVGEVPILYLDLQPRNLILCHEQVKLLDFDQAGTCTEANQRKERYGTPGFCAPEQKAEGELGVYTDVYQIGAILAYLLTGKVEDESIGQIAGDLGRIIRRCLRSDGKERYQSAAEIGRELKFVRSETGVSVNQSTSLIVAFAGTRHGAGVTHLALGLSAYLNRRGYPCLYEEWNSSGDVRAMAQWLGKEMDSEGIYDVSGVPVKPWYGQAVRLSRGQYPIVVRDYGCDWEAVGELIESAAWEADKKSAASDCARHIQAFPVLVTGGKWWEQEQGSRIRDAMLECLEQQVLHSGIVVVFNHVVWGVLKKKWRPESHGPKCIYFQAPQFQDPLKPTEGADAFFQALCERLTVLKEGVSGSRRQGVLWDFIGRIGKKQSMQKRRRR